MKAARLLATGAAAALVATSALAVGTSAAAADNYVTEFGVEGDSYPAGWFSGNVAAAERGTMDTAHGLEIAGKYQILNGTTPSTGLPELAAGAELRLIDGQAYFQVPVYYDHDGDPATAEKFTTLRTLNPNTPAQTGIMGGSWQISWPIEDADSVLFERDATAPLADFVNALGDYEILAFGALVNSGDTAHIASITWDGTTHIFFEPTATISAATITSGEMKDAGVTATFGGFLPGEDVDYGYSGGEWGDHIGSTQADGEGTVTITFAAPLAVGSYTLTAIGGTSELRATVPFEVTVNATVPTLPAAPDATPDVVLDPADSKPGVQQTITIPDGTFAPYEDVYATWYSTPVFGGWFQANAAGGLTVTVTVPAALPAGTHTLQLVGADTGVVANGTFVVLALATTGAEIAPLGIAGGALLLAGLGLVGVTLVRRRMVAAR